MAISASRSDINRRFMATMNSWPSDDDRLIKFRLVKVKYVQKDEQPQVTSSSGDSPQSTDVEEVVGPNTADPVEIDNHMRDIIFHTYSKELQPSDIGASRLYVPVDFAEILKTFGDAAIWTIISPPSPQGSTFLFQGHQNPTNPFDIRFGLGWQDFCKAHVLKPKDLLAFRIVCKRNLRMMVDIRRYPRE
ncbi:uncharacterized protein [Arachis hypogaea]|uniref:uncharacterized protein isoform X2 n=1 Tax=Arachis hypogaea TaxID=3818 RepID=UPI0007AEFC11